MEPSHAEDRDSPYQDRPPVVALVDDLMVASRIDAAAAATGRAVRYVRAEDNLVTLVRDLRPVAVVVGIAATRLPWADLIREVKSDQQVGKTYVLAFGPHKDLDLRRRALDAGANRVIANSAFMSALPRLLAAPDAEVEPEG